MQAIAIHKFARGSAQKARLVADQIRGEHVEKALEILTFSNKKAAELVKKERAKDKTHSVGYWAAEVIRMNSLKLDPRILAKMVDEEYGAGEEGTDELNAKYKKDTPGQ